LRGFLADLALLMEPDFLLVLRVSSRSEHHMAHKEKHKLQHQLAAQQQSSADVAESCLQLPARLALALMQIGINASPSVAYG
jgi:hypothetical protein